MKFVFIILLIALIALLTFGFLFFYKIFKRDNKAFDSYEQPRSYDPNSLMGPTEQQLHDYQAEYRNYFFEMHAKSERLMIAADDSTRLVGHLIRGTNPKLTVILVHGYRSSVWSDFCGMFPLFEKMGCNILYLDDRGHFESGGRLIGFSEKDQYDLIAWEKKMASMFDGTKIILFGMSMGGAAVIHSADKNIENVVGIIDDCGFSSISEITEHLMTNNMKLPYIPLGKVFEFWAWLICGYNAKKSNGYNQVSHAKCPILFIHGKNDRFVPVWMSARLYQACTSEKEMHVVENCGHAAACVVAFDEYRQWISQFIEKCCKEVGAEEHE